MGVRRPENDLVSAESGLRAAALRAEKLTRLDCLIGSNGACEMHQTQTFVHLTSDCCTSPTVLSSEVSLESNSAVRCTKLKHLFIS